MVSSLLLFVLVLIFLFLEVLLKIKFYQQMSPSMRKYIIVSSEGWQKLKPKELNLLEKYTNDLLEVGFEYVCEFGIESSAAPISYVSKLFVNKQESCFARISKDAHFVIYCELSTRLEQGWLLSINSCFPIDNKKYMSFSPFFRTPRTIQKLSENGSPKILFNSLVNWRQEVSSNLGGLEVIHEDSVHDYFETCIFSDKQKVKKILNTSITWGVIQTIWSIYHPIFEWLGDYPKLKTKS